MRELRKNIRLIRDRGMAIDKKQNVKEALVWRSPEDVEDYVSTAKLFGMLALANECGELFIAANPSEIAIFKGDMVSDRLGMGYLALN